MCVVDLIPAGRPGSDASRLGAVCFEGFVENGEVSTKCEPVCRKVSEYV